MHHGEYCDALEREAARFVSAAGAADPATPLPTCPEWTLSDLVAHVGFLYRWSRHHVLSRARTRVAPADVGGQPAAGDVEWVAAGVPPMLDTFRTHDPDDRVWGWGADRHARFWPRRMLFETVIHRADAEVGRGVSPEVDTDLAVDGIDELLANFAHAGYFAPGLAELRGGGESLGLVAEDAGESWRLRLVDAGYAWDWGPAGKTATVRGTAADLLLLVYGRAALDGTRFTVDGDDQWAARTLRHLSL
jgi:uncharacterized protein (TIGR03083 family)